MKTILIVMGPPGSGKGTQAALLKDHYHIAHISTGDMFRAHIRSHSELGILADSYISKGQYVPDDVTINMLKKRIAEPDCHNGFILDGFPRTIPQAEFLDTMLEEQHTKISGVIFYDVADQTVIARIKKRAELDRAAGKIVRADDLDEAIIQKRLDVYHKQTNPVLAYYQQARILRRIDAEGDIDFIFKESLKQL